MPPYILNLINTVFLFQEKWNPFDAVNISLRNLLHKHPGYFLIVPEIAIIFGALIVFMLATFLNPKNDEKKLQSVDSIGVSLLGASIFIRLSQVFLSFSQPLAWTLGFILFFVLLKTSRKKYKIPYIGALTYGAISALFGVHLLNFADLPANDPKPWTFGALVGFVIWYISRFVKQKDWVPSLALFWQLFSISTTFLIIHETSRHFSIELGRYWGGLETFDPFSIFWELTIDIITIFIILLAWKHPALKRNRGEFFAILMIAGASLMFMVASSDLVAIYLMTEFSSICLYLLVGYSRAGRKSPEAILKYFLVGVFSGVLILFSGMLFYGLTGTTNLYDINFLLSVGHPYKGLIGIAMAVMIAGMGYKIAIAPFHQWFPDAVEGAPAPISGYISLAPKVAGLCVWMRLFLLGLAPITDIWIDLLIILSMLSMTMGNLSALKQKNIKRMLAYSSIAHVGFVMMAIAAAGVLPGELSSFHSQGFQSALFYMFCYVFMNAGAFGVVSYLETKGIEPTLNGFRGLSKKEPLVAAFMVIFLASLAGIPPTAGAWAKWTVFISAMETQKLLPLVIVAGINTVIALYYYFAVAREMYLQDSKEKVNVVPNSGIANSIPIAATLIIAAITTLVIGIYPDEAWKLAAHSDIIFIKVGIM
tara:strand:+ start:25 stop:1971 length:1947 start_codon:yes stop_codon:yes gene_type:complete